MDKAAKQTTYMREYKRKEYAKNGQQIRDKNKAYYYKYKFGLDTEMMKKYDTLLPLCSKLIKNLEELKTLNADFLREILLKYGETESLGEIESL